MHILLRHATVAVLVSGLSGLVAGCSGASSPDNGRPKLAETWFRRAQREYKDADFDEAHDSAQKALAIVAEDPEVRLIAAEVALASLEYSEVLRLLKGVPGTEAARLRGRALWYKGDLEAAADELEAMLNDPEAPKDEWAKAMSKLARHGAGHKPFDITGGLLGAVEMVVVSQVAPYFVVPIEIDGVAALAMIATGSGEVIVDSATRQDPSWVSLRFDKFEVRDVPALPLDLSGISKDIGAPIKVMLGVNLLRHLNATFDFTGHQFVARSFAPPPPPEATRIDLHYARGGAMVVRGALGGKEGQRAAFMVDTQRPFALALDNDGWKKAGVDMTTLRLIPGDPEQKLREGAVGLHLGAFDMPHVSALTGFPLADLEKQTAIDLDGVIGASLLYRYRCTFADGGRVLWIEDDAATQRLLGGAGGPPPAGAPAGAPSPGGPGGPTGAGPALLPAGPTGPSLIPPKPGGGPSKGPSPVNERETPPLNGAARPAPAPVLPKN